MASDVTQTTNTPSPAGDSERLRFPNVGYEPNLPEETPQPTPGSLASSDFRTLYSQGNSRETWVETRNSIVEDTLRLLTEGRAPEEVLEILCETTRLEATALQDFLEDFARSTTNDHDEIQPVQTIATALATAAALDTDISNLEALFPISGADLAQAGLQSEFDKMQVFVKKMFCEEYFEDDSRITEIIAAPPARAIPSRRVKPPVDMPPVIQDLYKTPLLDFGQEQHLFRKYNFFKFQIDQELNAIDRDCLQSEDLTGCRRLFKEAAKVREQIAHANLRLVVNIAKPKKGHVADDRFFERISDGNTGLLIAIDGFDYTKTDDRAANGRLKFATYATYAIRSAIARDYKREIRIASRFKTAGSGAADGADSLLDKKVDSFDSTALEADRTAASFSKLTQALYLLLEDRELTIVEKRFGIATGEVETLKETGEAFDITKERVRQLETRALLKMRVTAAAGRLPIEISDTGRPYFDSTAPSLKRFDPAVVETAWTITSALKGRKRAHTVGELKVEFDPQLADTVQEAVDLLQVAQIIKPKGHGFIFNKAIENKPGTRKRRY